MNRCEWETQQTQPVAAQEYRERRNQLAIDLDGKEGIRPVALYDTMNKVLRKAFAKRFAKPCRNESRSDTKTCLRNNKQHERINEYVDLLKG